MLDGKLNGTYQELDSTGQVRLTCHYQNGLRHGSYREYSPDGKLLHEALYDKGVWLPTNQKELSFIQLYQKVSTVPRPLLKSTAFALLNRQLYTTEPLRYSAEAIDTLAAVIWKISQLAPHYDEWITSSNMGDQVLRIRLIESYHKDLKNKEIWTSYSKELLNGLKELKVTLPDFEFVNGEAYVSIPLKGWINQGELKRLFPTTAGLYQLMNLSNANGEGPPVYPRYTIEQINLTTWRITLSQEERTYSIILYGDGTAEIEQQSIKWGDFLTTDLNQIDTNYKWRIHE